MPATSTDRLYGLTTSVAVKPPVQISADSNVITFGEQTITSTTFTGTRTVTTTKGMRVLLTGQSDPIDNGIWEAMPATWRRAPDFDGARDSVNGTLVFSVYGDCWQVEAEDPVRIGYDPIQFRSTYPFSDTANLYQRTLRVPEPYIKELPDLSHRINKQLGFDASGNPTLLDPADTGSLGYILVDSFEDGAEITSRFQALHYQFQGQYYRWDGSLPKLVPSGSTPDTTGGVGAGAWVSVGDASVRSWVNQNFEEAEYKKLQNVSFATGSTILNADEVLFNAATGFYYQYKGQLPVTVAPGSTPDANWRCVGDANYPLTVESFGAVSFSGDNSAGVASSSSAFQLMFDNLNCILVKDSTKQYVIDKPVLLRGSYWTIDLSGAKVFKRTSTKSGVTGLIPVFGGYAPSDVNCVFMGVETIRYFQIKNMDIWCHEAPMEDRPVGIYIPSATNYRTEGVNFRGCYYDIWVKNAWRGTLKDIRGNESISHSCFYDASRTDASGVAVTDTQSATSIIFDGYYANAPGGSGIYLNRVDYSNIVMAAVDHAVSPSYTFIRSNVVGALGAENATVEYLNIVGGVLDLYLSTYDAVTDNAHYIMNVSGTAGATVNLRGQFRTQKYRLANVQGGDNVVVVDRSNFYNGSVTTVPQSVCAAGNFLDVHVGIGGVVRKYRDGVMQEVREAAPTYTTPPTGTGSPYYSPIFRVAMSAGGTSIQIPMYRIKEVFPNFNRSANSLVEYLRIKVTNGSGVAAGASFFCTNDAVVVSQLTGQYLAGNGSTDATVTGITANSSNLTISFSGSIASGSVIELSYL